jgi:hypothetical protein
LKGKALRKSPDASRGYPSWSRNLSLFQVKYKIPREGKRNFCYSCRFKIRESFAFKDLFLFEFIMTSIASQGEKLLSLKIFYHYEGCGLEIRSSFLEKKMFLYRVIFRMPASK